MTIQWDDEAPSSQGGIKWDDAPAAPAADVEPADHGLAARQKLSPLGKALSPITSYPETYSRMRKEAGEQVSRGVGQMTSPDNLIDPEAHGLSDVLTGAGNVAMGGLGYLASPVNAAYRSVVGQPVEDVTGIPREYTDFAAQLATPGVGFSRLPKAPGAASMEAPRVLPPHADAVAAAKTGEEFGLNYSLGQATNDLDRIRYEDMAARGAHGKDAQEKAASFFEQQYADIQSGARGVGQRLGSGEQPLASPTDAGAALNTEIADRATSAQRMRDQVIAHAEQAAEAQRQRVAGQGQAIDQGISQGRPPVEPREAGEAVNQGVREAAATNRAEFRGLYNEFGQLPGEFDVSAVRGMGNRIRNELTYSDNPVIIDEGTPAASRAIQALDEMSQPRITNRADPHAAPDPQEISAVTLRGVDQMRKRLVGYYQQARANPSDARAVRAVMNGFDNQIERAITENLFSGDPRALQALQDARASYSRYRQTFSPQGAGDDVGTAMRRIVDRNATPEETANMIIGSGKIGNAGLPVRIADRLEQVLGADSETWRSVRQAMWSKASQVRNSAGEVDPARSATNIESFANSTLGRRMFPQEGAAMRNHAQGIRELDRVIENMPATHAAERARTLYEQAFGGADLSGTQRAVFRRMVDGTATPEETAQAMFSTIGAGNSGNTVRALQAIERIVGRDHPIMGEVRQGVWQKLTQNPFGKDQQGQQKMVQGINEFLNGKGRTIARQLYSGDERAMMGRYGEAVRRTIIPKYSRTNSDTAPAMLAAAQKYSRTIGTMLGLTGHGLARHAVGAMIDKGVEKVAAARQAKKLSETFGDVTASQRNPLAPKPGKSRALVRSLSANPASPYGNRRESPYSQ